MVIPAFNEAASVGAIVDRLHAAVPALDVLVVDDGSCDDTAAIARRAGARVVSHVFNMGYGAALQTGYKFADRHGHAFVVQIDADGQHDPAQVPAVLAPVLAGTADVVIGSRFVNPSGYHMGLARSAARRFFARLLVACGGPHILDPTSGFQALARPVFRFCCTDAFPADFPDVDVLLLYHRQGFRMTEVPVAMAPNRPGHVPLHSGLLAVYYPYKMLLATFRSLLTPRRPLAPDVASAPPGPPQARPSHQEERHHGSQPA